MKNILKFLFISTLFITFSCDDEEVVTYEGLPFATFAETSSKVTVVPDNEFETKEIVASILSPQGSDVTLSVNVDTENSTAEEGVDFVLESNTIVIPAGQTNGTFILKAFSGPASTEGKDVVLNISSPDVDNAQFATTHVATIQLACPLPDDFPLEYGVLVEAFGDSAPTHLQTITPVSGEDNTFTINSMWGEDFVGWATGDSSYNGQYVYSGKFTINCDNTVDFYGDDSWAIGGSGTYDPNTGYITGTIGQELFTSDFTANITMIPNQ